VAAGASSDLGSPALEQEVPVLVAPTVAVDVEAGFDVFCGVDVAKETHHAVALDRAGRRLVDAPLPNDETALRQLLTSLSRRGRLLVVVDQPASIGALTIAVARDLAIPVAYLPGLTMRRVAQLYPGEVKTDARDAFIIADAARTLPHTLRSVGQAAESIMAMGALAGFDADLAQQATRLANRLHDALLHVHPALEQLLGRHFRRAGVLQLLAAAGTPAQLQALGSEGMRAVLAPRSRRLAQTLPQQILTALDRQSVAIPATEQYGRVISGTAVQLLSIMAQRAEVADELEVLLPQHPLAEIVMSMPGVGARTTIEILKTVGDGSTFPTAGHFAAYAGLAPVTRQSGTSIRGERAPRRGNRTLKTLLYLAAFASLKHPPSRAYYDRKRAQGKNHPAALVCLARRRVDVLYAMIRDHRPYENQSTSTTAKPAAPPARTVAAA
jgi:transposase